MEVKPSPQLLGWLRDNGYAQHTSGFTVDKAEVDRLMAESRRTHPSRDEAYHHDWACYSILARNTMTKQTRDELGGASLDMDRWVKSSEAQAKGFHVLKGKFEEFLEEHREEHERTAARHAAVLDDNRARSIELADKLAGIVSAVSDAQQRQELLAQHQYRQAELEAKQLRECIQAAERESSAQLAAAICASSETAKGELLEQLRQMDQKVEAERIYSHVFMNGLISRMDGAAERKRKERRWSWAWGIALLVSMLAAAIGSFAQVPHDPIILRAQDEGVTLAGSTRAAGLWVVNCAGAGVVCSWAGSTLTLTVGGGGGTTITIREVDGTPTEDSSILEFDQADGFVMTEPVAGTARIDLSNAPDAAVSDAITLTNITQITNRAISDTTGTLLEGRGGTGESTYTLGDLLYSNATNLLAKLAGNITTAKQFLTQTGDGAISAAPVWAAIVDGDIPAAIARDAEINVQGTANEITSSGSGVAPTLSLAAQLNVSGKEIIGGATPVKFEGTTDDNFYSQFTFTDPSATRTHTFPNADSNTVQPDAGAANNFLTAISSLGVISKAQPAFTNLSGTASDGQVDGSLEADELVLAGDVDGTANANDLDEVAVEPELEAVLDLADLQGDLALGTKTSGDYVSTLSTALGLTGSGTGETSTPTVAIDWAQTLAGNPLLAISTMIFSDDCAGGGFLSEGSTANTNEQLHCFKSNDEADTTREITENDATQTLTNKTLAAAANVIEADTGDSATGFFADQHAGTDLTADLEEEAHVTEHAENGADELLGEAMGTACTENQILKANATGGLDCAADATGAGSDGFGTIGAATADAADDTITVTDTLSIDITTTNDPEDLAAAFRYDQTQAGNPALGAEQCIFTTDGTGGGGILCEGTTADTNEGLLQWNPTTDKILTLPDATDTLVGRDTTDTLTNKTITAASNAVEADDLICTNCIGPTEITDLTLGTDTAGNYVDDVTAGTGIAVTHTPGEGSDAAVAFDYSDAGADPALSADQCRFTSNATVGGYLVCEGDTADTFESRIAVTDPTADRVLTIPNADSNPVQPLTCSGTNKVSAVSAAGVITCTTDETTSASANFETSFTALTTVTVTGATHGIGHRKIIVSCYDAATPKAWLEPNAITVNSTNFDVIITFLTAQTGTCVLNGSGDGVGGQDSIRVEDGDNAGTFTGMSDADFDDSGDINFTRAAGPPDVITATVRTNAIGATEIADLDVASGGTGAATLTGLLQGNGTSAFTAITNSSTVGQTLRVTGASTYAWGALDLADADAITGDIPDANLSAAVSLLGQTIEGSEMTAATVTSTQLAAANKQLTKSITILDPTTALTNKAQLYWHAAITLQEVTCSSLPAASTVTIQLDERAEATPNTAGTNSLTASLVCDDTSETTTSFSDSAIAAEVPHNLQITAVAGTPTAVRIHIRAQIN